MPLTKRSKLKEVWRHPVGHDLLRAMLRQAGRTQRWLEGPLTANVPLYRLDGIFGEGFCDALLEMAAASAQAQPRAPEPEETWWRQAVVYHIFLPSFMDSDHDGVGDLNGVAQRLPYLEKLGVDTLLLWPLADEDAKPGHNVRHYGKLKTDAGTLKDFKALAHLMHTRGMRLLVGLDIAAASPEHEWFTGPCAGEMFVLRPGAPQAPPNNWAVPLTGPVWRWYPQHQAFGLHLHGRHKLDLNWDNPALCAAMAQVLRFWQKAGADGFCFGPLQFLSKSGYGDGVAAAFGLPGACGYEKYAYGPKLHHILRELRAAAPKPAVLLGHMPGVGAEMAKAFTDADKSGLDMVLDASHLVPRPQRGHKKTGENQLDLAGLKQHYLYWMEHYGAERWMPLFLETPETPRIVSRFGVNPLYRGVLAKLLATLLFTLKGIPVLFQGQELGLANTRFKAAELREPASLAQHAELAGQLDENDALQKLLPYLQEHARTPMPWSTAPHAGFTGAEPWMRLPDGADYLNAETQMQDGASVWRHHQRLIALRKAHPCLVYGEFRPVFAKRERAFCYFRIYEGEKWYVEMNLTEREIPRPGRILSTQRLALGNYGQPAKALRPYEANVYLCE